MSTSKSYKEKAAAIDFSTDLPSVKPKAPTSSRASIDVHLGAVYRDRELAEENKKLSGEINAVKDKLAEFESADLVKRMDPNLIKASHWANRAEASFLTKDFESLKKEIESAGGNVQPIKVRPIPGVPEDVAEQYEIVFGHRRHRACLELGIDVLALVEELTDADLFAQMDRENRQRADLRPYEQGVMYAKALDEGLFASMRKMAEALGVSQANVSKAVALARLPQKVLDAFSSPLDIHFNWAALLTEAIQKDPDIVLSRAAELAAITPKPGPGGVLERLIGIAPNTEAEECVQVTGKSGATAQISFNSKKKTFSVDIVGLDKSKIKTLEKLLKEL